MKKCPRCKRVFQNGTILCPYCSNTQRSVENGPYTLFVRLVDDCDTTEPENETFGGGSSGGGGSSRSYESDDCAGPSSDCGDSGCLDD